jgi:hypothetical protein
MWHCLTPAVFTTLNVSLPWDVINDLQAGRMDVVWGETAGVTGQLWVFYPLLFTLQVCWSL